MSIVRHSGALLRSGASAVRASLRDASRSVPKSPLVNTFSTSARPGMAKPGTGPTSSGSRRPPPRPSASSVISTWLTRAMYAATGAVIAGGVVVYISDPKGTKIVVKAIRDDIEERIRYFTEPSRDKLLPDFNPRYPGEIQPRTLVIELDETLIHTSFSRSSGWRIAKRPGAEAFLAYLFNFYEIVVFTSKLPMYVEPILAQLDPKGYISHRLYRPETKFEKGVFVKDLSVLNRDLSRVVVIDHDMRNLKYHRENAIEVPKWTGDPSDTTLLELVGFLESLAKENVADVREHLAELQGVPIKEGVASHRAAAPERAIREQEKQGLFGAASMPSPPPPARTGEEEEKKAPMFADKVSSRLFHPSAKLEIPKEAEQMKRQR